MHKSYSACLVLLILFSWSYPPGNNIHTNVPVKIDESNKNKPTKNNISPVNYLIVPDEDFILLINVSLDRPTKIDIPNINTTIVKENIMKASNAVVKPPKLKEKTKRPAIMGPPHPIPNAL